MKMCYDLPKRSVSKGFQMSLSPWTIFVVQHSHIDLGFTDRQELIAEYHAQFIDQALAFALSDANQSRPAESRFKFTLEGFWAVEQYLAAGGPEREARLVQAIRSGTVELTAFYLHLCELLDLGHLTDTLAPAREFAGRHGLPLTTAMACDINGLSWGMADALADIGVKYISSSINPHHGGNPNGGPLKAFRWEGPRGGQVLVWDGLPYHKANLLGLMGGCNPVGNAGVPGITNTGTDSPFVMVDGIAQAERLLLPVLEGLEAAGYPYQFLPLMGSGLYTDNSPPTDAYCAIIQEWNAAHGQEVKIQTATLAEFFAHAEPLLGDIPTFRGDWPDWWSDGAASAPADTLLFRHAQRAKRLAERLDPGGVVMSAKRRRDISQALCLYAEHTFGYSDTASPKLLSRQVFARKSKTATEADEAASNALDAVLRLRGQDDFTAHRTLTYKIINTGPARAGFAALPVDPWEMPALSVPFAVADADGRTYPAQIAPDSRGRSLCLTLELGAGEERTLRLLPGSPEDSRTDEGNVGGGVYENAFVRAEWSDTRGITALTDGESGREILDSVLGRALGAPVYQIFPGANRWDAAGFNFAPRFIPKSVVHEGVCRSCRISADGPVFTVVTAEYAVAGTRSYAVDVKFIHALRQVEIAVRTEKTGERDPEGLYAAFPFSVPGGVWHLDKPGGLMRPGLDQIPGTCADYYCVQDGAAYLGENIGLVWTTLDAPLVHLGDLRLWQYNTAKPDNAATMPQGPAYAWLTNNKWDCNFPLDMGGNYEFRFVLEAGPHLTAPEAAQRQLAANANPFTVLRTG